MDNPKVSVIIPVYNTGKYLFDCLNSIINQTYKNIEIIIVDDGSTDDSPKVCDDYAQKDNRIKVIHKKNEGVSKARNTGIEVATGDFFYFPDSDDYIELDSLEYLLNLMNDHDCDMVSFEYSVTYKDREIQHSCCEILYGLFDKVDSHMAVLKGIPFACNKFYSKKAIGNVRYKEDIYRGEDSLFVHECIEQIDKMWFDKRPLYHYVQSEESACRGKFRPVQLTGMLLFDEYKFLFKEKYPELWECFCKTFCNLPITLYYDMYNEKDIYAEEMKKLYKDFKEKYKETKKIAKFSKKNKVKFGLFNISPSLFCRLHKIIHKL